MVLIHEPSADVSPCPPMSELMTRDEMESRYPDEWIFVVDPDLDEHDRVVRGIVKCHSKDPHEIDRIAIELRPGRSAMFFTAVTRSDEMFALLLRS